MPQRFNRVLSSRAVCFAFVAACMGAALRPAHSHPVTFPENWMIMSELDRNWQDSNAWYTFAPDHAVGVGYNSFRNADAGITRRIPNLHYNYRVKRWNMPDAQANIFWTAGAGVAFDDVASAGGDSEPAAYVGIEADWENRRFYTLYQARAFWAEIVPCKIRS